MNNWIIFQDLMAQAAEGAAQNQPDIFELLMLPMGMLVILYFFMWRPQVNKAKEHRRLMNDLKPGDEIVTTGGIIGKIKSVTDTFVSVEVASGTTIKVIKGNVSATTKSLDLSPSAKPASQKGVPAGKNPKPAKS